MEQEIPEVVREYMRGQSKKSYAARIKKYGKAGERKRLTEISRAFWATNKGKPKVEITKQNEPTRLR
jgi:hypothetical protein